MSNVGSRLEVLHSSYVTACLQVFECHALHLSNLSVLVLRKLIQVLFDSIHLDAFRWFVPKLLLHEHLEHLYQVLVLVALVVLEHQSVLDLLCELKLELVLNLA